MDIKIQKGEVTTFIQDPASAHFTQADLTLDGQPHDLDVSPYIPANAKSARFNGEIVDITGSKSIRFTAYGNNDFYEGAEISNSSNTLGNGSQFTLRMTTAQKIKYKSYGVPATAFLTVVSFTN